MNYLGHNGNNHPYQGNQYQWRDGFQNQFCNINRYARPQFPNPQVSEMPFLFDYHGSRPYIRPSIYNQQQTIQGGRSYFYNRPRGGTCNMGGLSRHGDKAPAMNQSISRPKPQVLDNTEKISSQSESSGPTCSIDMIKPFLEGCVETIKETLLKDIASTNLSDKLQLDKAHDRMTEIESEESLKSKERESKKPNVNEKNISYERLLNRNRKGSVLQKNKKARMKTERNHGIESHHENEELETMARKVIEEAMANSVITKCSNCKKSIITEGFCNLIRCECGEWTCYGCEGPLKNNVKLCNCDFLCRKRALKSRYMAAGAIKKLELKMKYPTLKFKYDPTKFKARTTGLGASTTK